MNFAALDWSYCVSAEHWLDSWAKASVVREEGRPRWQKILGNFGFGFIFLGAVLNLALFLLVTASGAGLSYLYKPWWLTYTLVSYIPGWYWQRRARSRAEA